MDDRRIIGVDLGGTNVRAGSVRHRRLGPVRSAPIDSLGTADAVLAEVCALIDRADPRDADGIGIGVPSVVDVAQGIVYDVQNIPSWQEVPVKAILEERYGIPVLVNNDANCFALGEAHFGQGIDRRSVIGLIVGTGFAGGIVLDGRLYAGANCGAGEFGMIPYLDGIYEHYCSGQFFTRHLGRSGAQLYHAAADGDRTAREAFETFGRHLGLGIQAILYAYDPEIIVLGGSVRKAFRFFENAMWDSIRTFAFSTSLRTLRIVVSELEHVAILGAAALHFDAAPGAGRVGEGPA